MKEFKGTTGPWFAVKNDDCEVHYVCKKEVYNGYNDVCTLYIGSAEEQHANASLIASAPELLEVLQKLLYSFNDGDLVGLQVGYKIEAEAAIAKALGEAK